MDNRIGRHGLYEPVVCAVTGEPIASKHTTCVHLDNEHYVFVLSSQLHYFTEGLRAELMAVIKPLEVIPSTNVTKPVKKESGE